MGIGNVSLCPAGLGGQIDDWRKDTCSSPYNGASSSAVRALADQPSAVFSHPPRAVGFGGGGGPRTRGERHRSCPSSQSHGAEEARPGGKAELRLGRTGAAAATAGGVCRAPHTAPSPFPLHDRTGERAGGQAEDSPGQSRESRL